MASARGGCLLCGEPVMGPDAQFCLPCVVDALRTAKPEIVDAAIAKHDDEPEFAAWLRSLRDGAEA